MKWSKKEALTLSISTFLTWDGPFITSLENWYSDNHSLQTAFLRNILSYLKHMFHFIYLFIFVYWETKFNPSNLSEIW